jgi:fumarate hydratase subunit alpha
LREEAKELTSSETLLKRSDLISRSGPQTRACSRQEVILKRSAPQAQREETMREINVKSITEKVRELCMEANTDLGGDVLQAFDRAMEKEESPLGLEILKELKENARIAKEERVAMCQDTGFAVIFMELGQDVHLVGGDLKEAIFEGVRRGYRDGYLRKSICHPFTRANTGDNTPAIIHTEIVPGDKVKVIVAPKGGGSENMSRVVMLTPSDGVEGIKRFVVQRVKESGSNPCPPTIVGVGIGGTFEQAALLAKKSLLRSLGSKNPDPELEKLESEILTEINKLGIGPQGLGGRTTSLAVHILMMPCHIASFPLAVNIQCHAQRHKEAII